VMFPTNGVGFGHFTRMLALAKRLKAKDPSLEIIFFTTMPTLHLLKSHGIPAHFVSGPEYFRDIDTVSWNALIEEELTICFETHRPKAFIFDGAFPYRGMLRAIQAQTHMSKAWMRRGTFRQGSSIPVDSITHFDLIIHPQDSVPITPSEINHGVPILRSPPIVLLDESELLTRESARTRLSLPIGAKVIYVQLGAGKINDINSEVRFTVEALVSHPDVHVILGESLLGGRLQVDLPRVHIIRDYPNAMYFRGFDGTVQAGGYNSFHETRRFGLPALFYPNMNTGMDDQLARCLVAEREGWGEVLRERKPGTISLAIDRLLSRLEPNGNISGENGADTLADELPWFFQTGKCRNEGWMLPQEVMDWIVENIPEGGRILEFGSGHSSIALAEKYDLWSVEHDFEWSGISGGKDILAPITTNPTSTQNGEQGWYDPTFLTQLPSSVNLILIDGPPGSIGRSGILEYVDALPDSDFIIVDDTDRPPENNLMVQMRQRMNLIEHTVITSHFKRSDSSPRSATVLRRKHDETRD